MIEPPLPYDHQQFHDLEFRFIKVAAVLIVCTFFLDHIINDSQEGAK